MASACGCVVLPDVFFVFFLTPLSTLSPLSGRSPSLPLQSCPAGGLIGLPGVNAVTNKATLRPVLGRGEAQHTLQRPKKTSDAGGVGCHSTLCRVALQVALLGLLV